MALGSALAAARMVRHAMRMTETTMTKREANQQRSLEAGAAHGELKRKARHDDKRHDDGQPRKDAVRRAVGPAHPVRSRHDTPPDVSGET